MEGSGSGFRTNKLRHRIRIQEANKHMVGYPYGHWLKPVSARIYWAESFSTFKSLTDCVQGHANNIHCLALAVNQLLGCLFSLGGHDDIEDRLKVRAFGPVVFKDQSWAFGFASFDPSDSVGGGCAWRILFGPNSKGADRKIKTFLPFFKRTQALLNWIDKKNQNSKMFFCKTQILWASKSGSGFFFIRMGIK